MLPQQTHEQRELLAQLAAGNEMALDEMYRLYWKSLFTAAFNVLRDRPACEDIIQEVFMQLWIKRESIEIKTSLSGYLHAAVRYQVFHAVKNAAHSSHLFDNIDERIARQSADRDLNLKELNERINRVVETLPEQCRQIYKMSREEQLSHKEIAERLKISPKTVENQITIALRKLRIYLGDVIMVAAIVSTGFTK